jgi:hypothetical protein
MAMAEQTEVKEYRKELDIAGLPARMKALPVQDGWPVPWFVAEVVIGSGVYDIRLADGRKMPEALRKGLCWVCGQALMKYRVFVIGPMCAINRTTAEPPCHSECAEWSVKNCPFLIQKELKRNTANMPEGVRQAAGCPIQRQPGVALLWYVDKPGYKVFDDGSGRPLLNLSEPFKTTYWREGRPATRAEVIESIESGYPILEAQARQQDEEEAQAGVKERFGRTPLSCVAQLARMKEQAMRYLPAQ